MNLIKATSLILLATALSANASPRFALVRVKEIYSALPATVALQAEVKKEQEAIMKSQRAEQLRKIIGELQALQKELSDKAKSEGEDIRKVAQAFEIKRQEAQTLQQDFESYKSEQEKIINQKMVVRMRESLNRIVSLAKKLAEERGFEVVFDSSGSTNTGIPFVLYSKEAPDLTADVESALKDAAATASSPLPKPEAPPKKNK